MGDTPTGKENQRLWAWYEAMAWRQQHRDRIVREWADRQATA